MRRELLIPIAAVVAAAAVAAACKRDREPSPAALERAAAALPPPLAGSSFYRIDAGPQTPCTPGAPCEARLVLTALGGYKVNKDYPFKFVADPAAIGVALDGAGTFALEDAKTGTLTLRFRAAGGGPARLAGTFKLSVCTDDQCEIEEAKIQLELPVG